MDNVAAYTAGLVAAALMGAGFYIKQGRRALIAPGMLSFSMLISLGLGLLLSRAFTFFTRIQFLLPTQGWQGLFDFEVQGLSYMGGIAGILLACAITAVIFKQDAHIILDAMAPGVLLAALLSRLAEYFVSTGQGSFVENEALHFFPLAVKNQWDEWYYAVFMLEALFALLILWDALRITRPRGQRWQRALYLFFCGQMLCESLLAETIKWGFVRVNQLFCAIGAAGIMACWLMKLRRGQGPSLWRRAAPLVLIGVIALMVGLEFALDRWQETPRWLLYIAMSISLGGLAGTGLGLLKKIKV